MIDPFQEAYVTFVACATPIMLAMLGALMLGGMLGWLYSPGPSSGTPAIRAKMDDLRTKLAEASEKLALSGTIMVQHMQQRDDEATVARGALEKEVSALNEQVTSLKMALVAAKRVVPARTVEGAPPPVEKVVPDPAHLARIAHLERETARIPGLVKELNELRKTAPKAGKKVASTKAIAKPQPLPDQVYRVMSGTFGRRIEPDDLELVEGIGPKIAEQFRKNGLKTWADVAAAKPEQLKEVLARAGERFQMHDPTSWPEQCRMMTEHRWEELRKYQRKLSGARRTSS